VREVERSVNTRPLIMTPGPTAIDERVRRALSRPITNPDLDPAFFEFYKQVCRKVARIAHTDETVLIMAGEGILGLEAAVASLVEPGEEVLCLANGVFGHGFADFVAMYGGVPVKVERDFRQPLTVEDLEAVLAGHPKVRVATMVHCETPSGLLNPVQELCPFLSERGIITIVDAVASLGGDEVRADAWKIDVLLAGSQKALSAPPGLTMVSVSERAWEKIKARREPVRGFYLNLNTWREAWLEGGYFPYTQPVSDLYALDEACDILLEDLEGALARHRALAAATRHALTSNGLELYPESHFANTVTAFVIPRGLDDEEFRGHLWRKYRVMIAGSWGRLAGQVWRIGHMGYNASRARLAETFLALDAAFGDFGRTTKLAEHFSKEVGLSGP